MKAETHIEVIDFKTIDEHGPQSYRAAYDVAVDELDRDELASVGSATIQVNAKQGDLADEYIADGTVSFTADLTCSRCAEPYPIANTSTFHVRFRPRPEASEENEEVEITARGGNFMTVHNSSSWRLTENEKPREWREPLTFISAGDSGNDTGHLAEIVDFVAAIQEGRTTRSNIYESYKSMLLHDAIRESARTEQVVGVRYEC